MGIGSEIALIAAIGSYFGAVISFTMIVRRDELKELRLSGQKISLNETVLRSAFRRRDDDPLKVAHLKLAEIGLRHSKFMLWGVFLSIIFVASVEFILGSQ